MVDRDGFVRATAPDWIKRRRGGGGRGAAIGAGCERARLQPLPVA
eukprot:COSAG06_NODE_49999_length_321_cov_1.171171_2_plen_44_part_01